LTGLDPDKRIHYRNLPTVGTDRSLNVLAEGRFMRQKQSDALLRDG